MDDFESGDADTIDGFESGVDDVVIQIAGVNTTVTAVGAAQVAGVASGVYLDTVNNVIYVSDGTNLGVINDVSTNIAVGDIEVF